MLKPNLQPQITEYNFVQNKYDERRFSFQSDNRLTNGLTTAQLKTKFLGFDNIAEASPYYTDFAPYYTDFADFKDPLDLDIPLNPNALQMMHDASKHWYSFLTDKTLKDAVIASKHYSGFTYSSRYNGYLGPHVFDVKGNVYLAAQLPNITCSHIPICGASPNRKSIVKCIDKPLHYGEHSGVGLQEVAPQVFNAGKRVYIRYNATGFVATADTFDVKSSIVDVTILTKVLGEKTYLDKDKLRISTDIFNRRYMASSIFARMTRFSNQTPYTQMEMYPKYDMFELSSFDVSLFVKVNRDW